MVVVGIKINREVIFHVMGRVMCLVVCLVIFSSSRREEKNGYQKRHGIEGEVVSSSMFV